MLKKFFDMDNPIMKFLTVMSDIIIVNLLFMVCSIPLFTIGASLTGLYRVTLKMMQGREGSVTRTFFEGFKNNFKQATIIWLILACFGGILYVDYRAMALLGDNLINIFRYGWFIVLLLYGFLLMYVFPLLATFENTIKNTIKNTFLMSISSLPYTLIILVIWTTPYFIMTKAVIRATIVTPLLFLTGFGLMAYLSSWCFRKVFVKFIPEEERADWEE